MTKIARKSGMHDYSNAPRVATGRSRGTSNRWGALQSRDALCQWRVRHKQALQTVAHTTGYSKQVTKGPLAIDPKETVEDNIQLVSLDLVLSFAGRQDPFRPYVKFGGGYLKKERFRQVNNGNVDPINTQEGMVPSAGLGFAVGVTKELSIKLGVDAWTSPMGKKDQPLVVDYAGRAGISWMF